MRVFLSLDTEFGKCLLKRIEGFIKEGECGLRDTKNCSRCGKKKRPRKGHVDIHAIPSTPNSLNSCPKRRYIIGRDRVFSSEGFELDDRLRKKWTKELLNLINETREQNGLYPLAISKTLTTIAKHHTLDQANQGFISHSGSDGSKLRDRVNRGGYNFRYAAENVASGQKNPAHVHASFMSSPGHAANVLKDVPDQIGIYVCRGVCGKLFWTEVFGKRKKKLS